MMKTEEGKMTGKQFKGYVRKGYFRKQKSIPGENCGEF